MVNVDDMLQRFKRNGYLNRPVRKHPAPPLQVHDIHTPEPQPLLRLQNNPELVPATKPQQPKGSPLTQPVGNSDANMPTHLLGRLRVSLLHRPRSKLFYVGIASLVPLVVVLVWLGSSNGSKSSPQTLADTIVVETEDLSPSMSTLAKFQSQSKFPLYYPKTVPRGYSIDKSSYAITQGLFSFKLLTPKGKIIPVVEQKLKSRQAIPGTHKNLSVNIGPRNFSTAAGIANIIATNEQVMGILTTEKTVIILNLSDAPGIDREPIMLGLVAIVLK